MKETKKLGNGERTTSGRGGTTREQREARRFVVVSFETRGYLPCWDSLPCCRVYGTYGRPPSSIHDISCSQRTKQRPPPRRNLLDDGRDLPRVACRCRSPDARPTFDAPADPRQISDMYARQESSRRETHEKDNDLPPCFRRSDS